MNPSLAPKTYPPSREGVLNGPVWAELAALLLVPAIGLARLSHWIDWRIATGVPAMMSLVVYFLNRSDKRWAEAGDQRVPEAKLHLGELAGGWPGAFLAQRKYRHKTSKISYQVTFWVIVLVHQFVALDFLLGWKLTTSFAHLIRS